MMFRRRCYFFCGLCAIRILYIDLSFCLGTIVCHVPYIVFYVMNTYIMMLLDTCVVSIPINILYNIFYRCILYEVLQLASEHADSQSNLETS